ncbi:nuclear transport factor 2 family protein [Aeromicrobium sp. 636]|uniref:Nuclear transport factor 2 family protein n=1 Tax=Aeromicrobium senzhongii TaxID=2663859 RepID=A0A8I0K2Y5_9ACTN|nr:MULTISPECIES: nuclear transport factor 2 family protein [Aeromicrobium]MBC9226495.1 nuclear transport factor 2 family protein [Aeromicrobium senzhongii]MCQ3998599.1 nuclear transport factor 2 family protein [Aeromicrobium sp. 636]
MTDAHQISERSLEEQVQWLLDREAIRDVMHLYCRGVDRSDFDLIRQAYHEDAFDDHGNFEGDREAVVTKVSKNDSTAMMHHIGNMSIELDGDAAWVETYFVAHESREIDAKTYNSARGGRYLDRFEKRAGRWAVAKRQVVDDWAEMTEVVGRPAVGRNTGHRSPDRDPWYAFRSTEQGGGR